MQCTTDRPGVFFLVFLVKLALSNCAPLTLLNGQWGWHANALLSTLLWCSLRRRSHRTKYITAGAHRTEAVDWACRMCGSLNGAGLSQIVFPAEVGRAQQFGCTRSWSWNLNTAPQMACRSTLTLPFDSYVMAEVSGHYYAAGPCEYIPTVRTGLPVRGSHAINLQSPCLGSVAVECQVTT